MRLMEKQMNMFLIKIDNTLWYTIAPNQPNSTSHTHLPYNELSQPQRSAVPSST